MKLVNIFKNNLKFTTLDIALMGMMMTIYLIIVWGLKQFLPGKFNISIEILFFIIFGIIFGPIKGSIFSLLCDTVYQLILGSIAFWMIEYAIVPPLVSMVSWFLMYFYEKENKFKFIFPVVILALTIAGVISFFVYQFINNSFKFENSIIDPLVVFYLMITLCIIILTSIIVALILYKLKKDVIYIKFLYLFSVVAIILIIFRWLWGPYAYVNFFNRFLSSENNPDKVMSIQYPITLAGIAMKTTYVLPIFVIILIPSLSAISISKKNYFVNRDNK
ncbi:MAG: hypothetical protein KFW07_03930 [Mycoplasmataceae bacterium]|nr:hypothetical protein [Mycoplasmataceae bacterium]